MNQWYYENWTDNTRFGIKYDKELAHVKTPFQEIKFYHSVEWGNFFTLDGLMMVTEYDEFIYHEMIVHVAMATNLKIKKVLIIGAGDGGTVREIAKYNHIEQIDVVEIDEEVINLSKKYLPKTAVGFSDKRVNIIIADGLKFVNNQKNETYDLILVDSTDPIGPGEGLFTQQFYQDCSRILSETGILINQHESPYFSKYRHEMKRAHQKIKSVFPIAEVYQFHQAVYPSGHWLFGFASKKYHPLNDQSVEDWVKLNIETNYYNPRLHQGSFALPTYVIKELNNES